MAGSCLWGHGPQASQAGTGTLLWPPGLRCRVPFGLVSTCVWSHKTRCQDGKCVRSILRKIERGAGRPGPKERGRRRQQDGWGHARTVGQARVSRQGACLRSQPPIQACSAREVESCGALLMATPQPLVSSCECRNPHLQPLRALSTPSCRASQTPVGGPHGGQGSPGLEPQLHS